MSPAEVVAGFLTVVLGVGGFFGFVAMVAGGDWSNL
jgi:hypothetical protein